jgi:hypothetical protein
MKFISRHGFIKVNGNHLGITVNVLNYFLLHIVFFNKPRKCKKCSYIPNVAMLMLDRHCSNIVTVAEDPDYHSQVGDVH